VCPFLKTFGETNLVLRSMGHSKQRRSAAANGGVLGDGGSGAWAISGNSWATTVGRLKSPLQLVDAFPEITLYSVYEVVTDLDAPATRDVQRYLIRRRRSSMSVTTSRKAASSSAVPTTTPLPATGTRVPI
jgi:hypothetical protein